MFDHRCHHYGVLSRSRADLYVIYGVLKPSKNGGAELYVNYNTNDEQSISREVNDMSQMSLQSV